MMVNRLLSMLVIAIAAFPVIAADTYRWEDEAGTVHYSDQPPPAGARNVKRTRMGGGVPVESLPYRLQVAVKKAPVTLYVTDCGDPCTMARELLLQRGVPHSLLDANLADVRKTLMALTSGDRVVPVASVGKIVLKGFEAGQWNAALDAAGYPAYAMIEVTPYTPTARDKPAGDESAAVVEEGGGEVVTEEVTEVDVTLEPNENVGEEETGSDNGSAEENVEPQENN